MKKKKHQIQPGFVIFFAEFEVRPPRQIRSMSAIYVKCVHDRCEYVEDRWKSWSMTDANCVHDRRKLCPRPTRNASMTNVKILCPRPRMQCSFACESRLVSMHFHSHLETKEPSFLKGNGKIYIRVAHVGM